MLATVRKIIIFTMLVAAVRGSGIEDNFMMEFLMASFFAFRGPCTLDPLFFTLSFYQPILLILLNFLYAS